MAKGCKVFSTIRKMIGWSQNRMAQELGISASQLDYTENTAKSVQLELLRKLFELSKLDGDTFMRLL